MDPNPCPDCRSGKPQNCTGHTWDDTTDGLVDCPGPTPETTRPQHHAQQHMWTGPAFDALHEPGDALLLHTLRLQDALEQLGVDPATVAITVTVEGTTPA